FLQSSLNPHRVASYTRSSLWSLLLPIVWVDVGVPCKRGPIMLCESPEGLPMDQLCHSANEDRPLCRGYVGVSPRGQAFQRLVFVMQWNTYGVHERFVLQMVVERLFKSFW